MLIHEHTLQSGNVCRYFQCQNIMKWNEGILNGLVITQTSTSHFLSSSKESSKQAQREKGKSLAMPAYLLASSLQPHPSSSTWEEACSGTFGISLLKPKSVLGAYVLCLWCAVRKVWKTNVVKKRKENNMLLLFFNFCLLSHFKGIWVKCPVEIG